MAGETRVAVTPETAKKRVAQGHVVRVQLGAGVTDAAYQAGGAEITDAGSALGADIVLKVRRPDDRECALMKPATVLIGMLNSFDAAGLQRLAAAGLTASRWKPRRVPRARSMDVLSSQANIAGYKAVMLAADKYQCFSPMPMRLPAPRRPPGS